MRALVLLSLLLVALSGCTGGSNLLMTTSDLGPGFQYVPIDDEEYAFVFEFLNMTSNPGTADVQGFEDEQGAALQALRAAIIEYNGSGQAVFSAVLTFENRTAAQAYYEDEGMCEDAEAGFAVYISGNSVIIHDGEDLPTDAAPAFNRALERYESRTGLRHTCTPDM